MSMLATQLEVRALTIRLVIGALVLGALIFMGIGYALTSVPSDLSAGSSP